MHFILFASALLIPIEALQVVWDNNVEFDVDAFEQQLARGDIIRMPNKQFIYPGTKWCGAGNIAEDENDLGTFAETDKCCRTHDFCPDIIEAYGTKYNLTNTAFYTRLNCSCDEAFYSCLKSTEEKTANVVGIIYFSILGTKCYREDYPIVECKKYSLFPIKKCVDYELDPNGEKIYQWFDVPSF